MSLARFGRCVRGVGLFFLFSLLMTGAARADRLSVVGRLNLPGTQTRIVADGSRAYLAGGAAGVHIVDVSNPTSPTLLGTLDTTGTAQGVAVAGARLYVADGASGLLVADVSDPAKPRVLGSYDTPGDAKSVVTSGTLAFVADGPHGLQIIDVSNPARPVKAGSYDTYRDPRILVNTSDSYDARDVKLYGGGYALLVDGLRLVVVDLRDLRNPVLFSRLVLDRPAQRVFLNGASVYLLLAYYGGPAEIVLSDPAFPHKLPGDLTGGPALGAAVSGSLLYLAESSAGVEVVDRTPGRPARAACGVNGTAWDVAAQGDLAYVANDAGGLAVLRRTPGPILAITGIEGYPVRGKPFKLHWISESLAGMLKLELRYADVNMAPNWMLANIPVSQGAAGYDVTIPANYAWSTNYLRLISEDGQTTAGMVLNVLDSPPGPDTAPPSIIFNERTGVMYGLQDHLSEVSLSGLASDESGIAKVEVGVDGGALSAADLYQQRYWRKVLKLGAGTHNIMMRVHDKAGNYSDLQQTFTPWRYDRIAPVVEVEQPRDLAALTGDCLLTVSGTASDLGTTSTGVVGVEMERNGDNKWQMLSGSARWSGQVRLTHGVNALAFRSIDGNAAYPGNNCSPVKTLSVYYDPPPTTPTLAIASPANRQPLAARTVRVSGTAAAGGANLDKVEVRVNGGAWKLASGTASWSLDCALVPGFNTIEACAYDVRNYASPTGVVSVICQPATDIISPRGSIGGLSNAIALKGSTVLMNEGTRVLVLNAASESNVVQLAAMELGEKVYDLAVSGNMAYVAAANAGLQVYDLTDPAHPQWRGGWRAPSSKRAVAVAVAGGYAYVRTDWFSLLIFDVSNPEAPRLIQEMSLNYGSSAGALHLALVGSRLFDGQSGYPLRIFDLTNPANPAQTATCGSTLSAFAVSGSTAILANGSTLTAYNLGNPGTALGSLALLESVTAIQYSGTHLLALLASGALDVIDASNPASLKRLGSVYMYSPVPGYALAATPTRAYVTTAGGLSIYETITNGKSVGRYATLGPVQDLAPAGPLAWVAGSGKVAALDLGDIDEPALLSTLTVSNLSPQGRVRVGGDRLYVPLANGAKQDYAVVDATNPARPVLTSGRISPVGSRSARDVAPYGNLVYVATDTHLEVYDCANMTSPVRVTSVTLAKDPYAYEGAGVGYMVERVGATLMVALSYQGLEFFDLTNPRQPEPGAVYYGPVRSFSKPSQGLEGGLPIYQMAVDGRNAVLTSMYSVPLFLDCPNAWMPREFRDVGSALSSSFLYPAVSGPWVALYKGSPGVLNLYKLSNSGALTQVDSSPSAPSMKRMVFAGNTLCLASGDTGLRLVRMNFPNAVAGWGAYE